MQPDMQRCARPEVVLKVQDHSAPPLAMSALLNQPTADQCGHSQAPVSTACQLSNGASSKLNAAIAAPSSCDHHAAAEQLAGSEEDAARALQTLAAQPDLCAGMSQAPLTMPLWPHAYGLVAHAQ